MSRTKIEWTQDTDGSKGLTINPIVGCSKISEGCQNCYAEKMAWRLKCMGIPKYQDVVDKSGWTGEIGVDFSTLNKLPKKPKKIFISSMGDLYCEDTTYWQRQNVMYSIYANPRHTFLILTKRPNIMSNFLKSFYRVESLEPFPNLWLGITAENQKRADERIPILLQIPAAVRFVSIEPMLKPVDLEMIHPERHYATGIWLDWVIAGPETGPGKRECKPEWIRNLYEQCQAAGVPFFDKTKTDWIAREFPNDQQQIHGV